ncbi:hypothetical protein [Cellulomonas soli]|uniref:Uncharacterized protein n=1 Tax=Cellulomonas soli TaxID=931535 RepID=A0A512PHV3_9CELL|nr:hypothetical protein [Cellulomonas soli]NYI59276.1 hypothetical protein [Cellulomonas soli]GEP70780.1 hypothetical protein CSO01_34950 [Cellulomonas soli]
MAVRLEDLQLVWPRKLFLIELRGTQVAVSTPDPWGFSEPAAMDFDEDKTGLLFEEAFHAKSGAEWLQQARDEGTAGDLLGSILTDPDRIGTYAPPVLYRDRKAGVPVRESAKLTWDEFVDVLGALLGELDAAGYFDGTFGSRCVDAHADHDRQGALALSDLMGSEEAWPPQLFLTTDDHIYTVVEAVHHLIARPRDRRWHSYGKEWDYSDFARPAGQAVYRWRVNTLLERYGTSLRLDSTGFLVETTNDPRDELIEAIQQEPSAPNADQLRHAVDLFRRRGATREDKRSAVVALAGILEEHRTLLEQELLTKDEGALFEIANRFGVRHQRADQHPDYDDAYLDWLFWWYLATVDLLKHLLRRGEPQDGRGGSQPWK